MLTKGMFTSNTPEWGTPQDFFDKLNDEFHFDLDIAASEDNHKCDRYYTKETDGLAHQDEWSGTVWCNPPYGREIGKWVEACSRYWGGSASCYCQLAQILGGSTIASITTLEPRLGSLKDGSNSAVARTLPRSRAW